MISEQEEFEFRYRLEQEQGSEQSYGKRVLTEGLPAVANMGSDILQSIPAGLAGLDTAIRTGSMEEAMGTFESGMAATREDLPRFRSDSAKIGDEALAQGMETLMSGGRAVGEGLGAGFDMVTGNWDQALDQSQARPGMGTMGEVATNFLPLPGTKLASRIPHVGSDWKRGIAAKQANEAAAAKILEEKMKLEKADADRKAYEDAYKQYDSDLGTPGKEAEPATPYGKDRVGPQYGGSREGVETPPDGFKPEGSRTDNLQAQEIWDAEMYRLGREFDIERLQQEQVARYVNTWKPEEAALPSQRGDLPKYDPETGQVIKERIKGPVAVTREIPIEETIASETRAAMAPRDRIENPDSISKSQLGYNERLRVMQEDPASFSVREMANELAIGTSIPFYKDFMKSVLENKTFNSALNLLNTRPSGKGEGWQGWYKYRDNSIELMKQYAGQEAVFVHEMAHAVSYHGIELALKAPKTVPHLVPTVNRLNKLFTTFREHHWENNTRWRSQYEVTGNYYQGDFYGMKSIHEFLAEARANPEFRDLLVETELPKGMKAPGIRTYWEAMVDGIRKIIGLPLKYNNYLSEVLKLGSDLVRKSNLPELQSTWKQFDAGNLKQGVDAYSFKQFKNDVKERGIALSDAQLKAMYDKQQPRETKPTSGNPNEKVISVTKNIQGINKIQRLIMETRTLEEIYTENPNIKDLDIGWLSKRTIDKAIPGDYVAQDHPILSWQSSNVNRIVNKYNYEADQIMHGDSRKKPSPGTYMYQWSKLDTPEKVQLNEVAQALQNSQTRLSNQAIQAKAVEVTGRMLTETQVRAYADRLESNSKILAKVNTLLRNEGRETINELPHYWSPAVFPGKFLTILEGKDGSRAGFGTYFKPDIAKLQKEFPNHKISEPIDRSNTTNVNFEQYVELMHMLDKQLRDPASRALAEAIRRRGFTKHGMKREGVSGALGTEGGIKGLNRYEETAEKYVRDAHRYLANRELDKLYNELFAFDKAKESPNAHSLALESIDQARGGMNEAATSISDAVGDLVAGTVKTVTFGKLTPPHSVPRDILRPANEMKSALLIGFLNIQFLGAQLLQSSFAVPKLYGLAGQAGRNIFLTSADVTKALAKSAKDYTNWSHPDLQKLESFGTFEATLRHDWSTYANDSVKFKQGVKDHLTGMSFNMWVESNAVRKPAALFFLNMLRELGYEKIAKTPDEIYWAAKNLTDNYMVSTLRHKKPHMFGRTGLLGTAVSPLKSFVTTWIGQLTEYSKQATKTPQNLTNAMPLATFLGLNVATAGLLGFIGVKEYDYIIEKLNEHFGTNYKTATHLVLENFKSTSARLGPLSDFVGNHVGSTFAAPTLEGMGGALGAEFAFDVGKAIWQLFTETGALGEKNKPTEAQKRDTLKSITPRSFAWGPIEKAYTPKEAPIQTKKGAAGPYKRSEKDWKARSLGMFTNEEVLGKAPQRIVEQMSANRTIKLAGASGRMVDALLTEEKGEERMTKIITELQRDNYTTAEIRDSLKNQLKAKLTEKDIRMMGRGRTNRQRLIIQLYEELR